MSNKNNGFNGWGFSKSNGQYIPNSSQYVTNEQLQEKIDEKFENLNLELVGEGQQVSLNVNNKNKGSFTFEDKFLTGVTFDECGKCLIFEVEGGEKFTVSLHSLIDENAVDTTKFVTKEEYNDVVSVLSTRIDMCEEENRKLTEMVNALAKEPAEIINDIKKGGTFTLYKNLKIEEGELTLTKDTFINLNGKELSAVGGTYGDTVVMGNAADITFKNGIILPAEKASVANGSATILVKKSTDLKLTLEDVNVSGVYPLYLNDANNKSNVTIKSGTFISPYDKGVAVYVQNGGKVVIEGGYFTTQGNISTYLLNLKDDLVKDGTDPRKYIEVKGGTFVNFNPAASYGEPNGPVSFVADGYTVQETINGNEIIYTVVKE